MESNRNVFENMDKKFNNAVQVEVNVEIQFSPLKRLKQQECISTFCNNYEVSLRLRNDFA